MDSQNDMELCEAVYFFHRMHYCLECPVEEHNKKEVEKPNIQESIWKAVIRILVVNNLLDYDGHHCILTDTNKEKLKEILEKIHRTNKSSHCESMFQKAIDVSQFFFNRISDLEYEIYSRYNFHICYEIGEAVAKHLCLDQKRVLELGGNSGGLGTALLNPYKNCYYTIVDMPIPCEIGRELNETNRMNIQFIEGDVFALDLSIKKVDYIIIMNLLHDFNDEKCLTILHNCQKYSNANTKILIIEDILVNEFEPKPVVMHGLRLAVECHGGKQRTIDEWGSLLCQANYRVEKTVTVNRVHRMLVVARSEGICETRKIDR